MAKFTVFPMEFENPQMRRCAIWAFKEERAAYRECDRIEQSEIPQSTSFSGWMRSEYEALIFEGKEPMPYEIENGVEIPPRHANIAEIKELAEALGKMLLGQSVFVPFGERREHIIRTLIANASNRAKEKKNVTDETKHFLTRKVLLPSKGIRVWRVEPI